MHERAIEHLSRDRKLARLIERIGPCGFRVDRKREPFAALVRSVTFQQLHGVAAETIFNRFIALFPANGSPTPQQILDVPVEKMRGAGLSGAKTTAIKDIAAKAREGVVPTRAEATGLTDAELVERLTTIRGVGPWTVEMLLIFTLGRKDVFPVTDFGVRKGFALAYGFKEMPTPKDLLPHGESWRPFRSIASWYFWRAADASK
ncbi:MAG TPA: DNA-3-methyladenine glycosylase [Candidatus Acidoferrum sp.]|nr:DNA-3-methyladenine glycosylase [Candidatus Acidoferrum sp.]